jgi:hypothetical protein
MKKLLMGIIGALVMLVPFINKIAGDADSAQDWTVGIAIIVVVLAIACWLVVRADRSETVTGPVATPVLQPPAMDVRSIRGEAFPAGVAAAPVCAACGAVSRGTKFCVECGKPFQAKNACSQCGAQLASGIKFCPECGRKAG